MPLELITERNLSEGLHILIVYINDISHGLFINMLLFMIWAAVTLGIFFANKRLSGDEKLPSALAGGAFVTVVSTVLLGLIDGLISTYTYVVVIVVALLSVMFFLFKGDL